MTGIKVGTDDFRAALRSVAPHVDPDPEFPQLHRVRLTVGPENLTVSATNRYTLGHTTVTDVSGLFPGKINGWHAAWLERLTVPAVISGAQ